MKLSEWILGLAVCAFGYPLWGIAYLAAVKFFVEEEKRGR